MKQYKIIHLKFRTFLRKSFPERIKSLGANLFFRVYASVKKAGLAVKFLMKITKNVLFWFSRKIDYPLVPPDMVQMNLTFDCNLRCKMCGMHEQKNSLASQKRKIELDTEVSKKIIKETKALGTKSILFIGGEPLLRKDLFELIQYAKQQRLWTAIVTNGVLLTEKVIEKCFDLGVDWLSISIDAAKEETFKSIRGEGVLKKIVENLQLLSRMKQERSIQYPQITAVCTIMDENIGELLDIVSLCRKIDVDKVLFQPVVAYNTDQTRRSSCFPGMISPERSLQLEEMIDELITYKKSSPQAFNFIANSIRYFELIKQYFRNELKTQKMPCYAGFNRVQVVQEGRIYFCVNQSQYEANFGDVRKNTLKELWYSPQARTYRKIIRECKAPCLQWCAYRDDFIAIDDYFQKKKIFVGFHKKQKKSS